MGSQATSCLLRVPICQLTHQTILSFTLADSAQEINIMLDTPAGVEGGASELLFSFTEAIAVMLLQMSTQPPTCKCWELQLQWHRDRQHSVGLRARFFMLGWKWLLVAKTIQSRVALSLNLTPSQSCGDVQRARVKGSPRCCLCRCKMIWMQAHNRPARERRRCALQDDVAVSPKNLLAALKKRVLRFQLIYLRLAPNLLLP
jgi:hypothetical protein